MRRGVVVRQEFAFRGLAVMVGMGRAVLARPGAAARLDGPRLVRLRAWLRVEGREEIHVIEAHMVRAQEFMLHIEKRI